MFLLILPRAGCGVEFRAVVGLRLGECAVHGHGAAAARTILEIEAVAHCPPCPGFAMSCQLSLPSSLLIAATPPEGRSISDSGKGTEPSAAETVPEKLAGNLVTAFLKHGEDPDLRRTPKFGPRAKL